MSRYNIGKYMCTYRTKVSIYVCMCTNVPLYVLCIHVRVCIIIEHFLSMRPVYNVQQYKFTVCTYLCNTLLWLYVRTVVNSALAFATCHIAVTSRRLRQHCSTAGRTDGSSTTQFATQACHTNNTKETVDGATCDVSFDGRNA